MTQEDREVLLRDLSARQTYGIHCCVFNLNKTIKEDNDIIYGIVGDNIVTLKSDKNECYMYYQVKPYLRPMSSMTEEEKDTYDTLTMRNAPWVVVNWLNANKFDYLGLIPKGLAIEVTEENNPYEDINI